MQFLCLSRAQICTYLSLQSSGDNPNLGLWHHSNPEPIVLLGQTLQGHWHRTEKDKNKWKKSGNSFFSSTDNIISMTYLQSNQSLQKMGIIYTARNNCHFSKRSVTPAKEPQISNDKMRKISIKRQRNICRVFYMWHPSIRGNNSSNSPYNKQLKYLNT